MLAVEALAYDSYVIQTYASIAVDKLLLMKGPDKLPILGKPQLRDYIQPLVTNIFKVHRSEIGPSVTTF